MCKGQQKEIKQEAQQFVYDGEIEIELKQCLEGNQIQVQDNHIQSFKSQITMQPNDIAKEEDIHCLSQDKLNVCMSQMPIEEIVKCICQSLELSCQKANESQVAQRQETKLETQSNDSGVIFEDIQEAEQILENLNEVFIPSHRKYAEDPVFRKDQISVAKFFIQYGYDLALYNQRNPKRKLRYNNYFIHMVSIDNCAIKDIQVYILINTKKYLTKLRNKQKSPLRSVINRIKLWLTDQELLQTFLDFIRIHYGFIKQDDANIKAQNVIRLYEIILSTLRQQRVILYDKQTDDINFYHLKRADSNYVFTHQEMKDLQIYTIQYLDIDKIDRVMSNKYNWKENWYHQSFNRKKSILDKLTNVLRVKIKSIALLSDLKGSQRFKASIHMKLVKHMLRRPAQKRAELKEFLKDIFELQGEISVEKANEIIKYINEYRKWFQEQTGISIKKNKSQQRALQLISLPQGVFQEGIEKMNSKVSHTLDIMNNNLDYSNTNFCNQSQSQQLKEDNIYSFITNSKARPYKNKLLKPNTKEIKYKQSSSTHQQTPAKHQNIQFNTHQNQPFIFSPKILTKSKKKTENQILLQKVNLKQKQIINNHSFQNPQKIETISTKLQKSAQISNQNMHSFTPEQMQQFEAFLEYQKFVQKQKQRENYPEKDSLSWGIESQEQNSVQPKFYQYINRQGGNFSNGNYHNHINHQNFLYQDFFSNGFDQNGNLSNRLQNHAEIKKVNQWDGVENFESCFLEFQPFTPRYHSNKELLKNNIKEEILKKIGTKLIQRK